MKSMNEVFLLGHVGRDPEVSKTRSGKDRATFSLATSYSIRADDGWDERTDWHKVVVFDWLAKRVEERLRKGDPVMVRGRMSSHKWTDDNGQARVSWSVVAREVSFLRSRRDGEHRDLGMGPAPGSVAMPPQAPGEVQPDDDIPF